ncbi:hypothetical protein CR513_62599, partial [Mucuna pruriens]
MDKPKPLTRSYLGTTTPPQTTIGKTPFQLAFGINTTIPIKVDKPFIKQNNFSSDDNSDAIKRTSLHLARGVLTEDDKEIQVQGVTKRLRGGRLGLEEDREAKKKKEDDKLATNWEGPFRVKECSATVPID